MAKRMIVDVQNHFLPMELLGESLQSGIIDANNMPPVFRWRGVTITATEDMTDIEKHLSVCREAGITHLMMHQGMLLTVADEVLGMNTIETARRVNENMAGLSERYPDIIFPYGYLKPHDGKEAVKEAERCLDDYGFKA